MSRDAKINRAWHLSGERPVVVQIHDLNCRCRSCSPPGAPRALTPVEIGKLCCLGVGAGTAIAFAISPHGALAALASCFGVAL